MSVSFQPYRGVQPQDMCGICHATVEEEPSEFVSHGGNGDLHPFHRMCITDWVSRSATCPSCRVAIDPSTLSLRGRISKALYPLRVENLQAVAFGLLAGICCNGKSSIPDPSGSLLAPLIGLGAGEVMRYFSPEIDKRGAAVLCNITITAGIYAFLADGLGI